MTHYKFDSSYESPNDLHLIVGNVYQLVILQYLIQLQNGYKSIYPSLDTLRLGKMSKPTADNAIDALVDAGYIKKIKHPLPKANEYIVHCDKINAAIIRALSVKELGKRAAREYSEKEKAAMTIRQAVKNPALAHRAEEINGNTVIDKDGEILNEVGR